MTTSSPFYLVAAFANGPFSGNPAAIIFMNTDVDLSLLQSLSKNFNQPMAAFVDPPTPPLNGDKIVRTKIRYVTPSGLEPPLCGHATLASARAILELPSLQGIEIEEIQFQTITEHIAPVRILNGGLLELGLPSSPPVAVPSVKEFDRLASVVRRAFKKDVNIIDIRVGSEAFNYVMMCEIHEGDDLASADVDTSVFKETGFTINAITSTSSKNVSEAGEEYVCRMFSPELPGGEDPVCGSIQCLLAPYWYAKKAIPSGKDIVSKQPNLPPSTACSYILPDLPTMSTLTLTWNGTEVYDLWSWSPGASHQSARTVKCIRGSLYTALIGARGQEPTHQAILKVGWGKQALDNLQREAAFYTQELLHLQGEVVPRFFGFYKTKIGDREFGCNILEYCIGLPVMDRREYNHQVMTAACRIHSVGITHNGLLDPDHHIILRGGKVCIVDFTSATRHQCIGCFPNMCTITRPQGCFCPELINLENAFGIRSGDMGSLSGQGCSMPRRTVYQYR
ncbi:Diaminopimelate epimerase-like protein [Coprinopsis marcescibilis]|uniref:Diaminopimelate epimerase-like protein n=1 Tax=Coprinopsis marcescibilis TaxID=230819 RepID=A0A5C3LE33_COPMA|nr:Diaminopimelate epimerase-like protein [Coprinopsis marcescibilis]